MNTQEGQIGADARTMTSEALLHALTDESIPDAERTRLVHEALDRMHERAPPSSPWPPWAAENGGC